jgi:Cys-tRNA(Pro) deacylase
MPSNPPVSQALSELNIPHTVFNHPGDLKSLQQAASERSQEPDQVVRTLLFRESKGAYLLVLVAGPDQINWKKLRQHLGVSRITLASRAEVFQVTGYELGAVAPFGLPQTLPVLVDRSVLDHQIISLGSGIRNSAIIMNSKDLLKALGDVEVIDLKGK